MASVIEDDGAVPDISFDVVIIGAGAAGLTAALRAAARGVSVLVIERDPLPRGSTALSAGLIPAPATRFQVARGIADSPDAFAADILRKADGEPDAAAVSLLAQTIGPAIEWLTDAHGLAFSVVDNFTYPGHSAMRMHGLPGGSGTEFMDALLAAADRVGVTLLTSATADTLYRTGERRICAVGVARPDGARERIGCGALILACNGYGGNLELVARHVPEMAGALYFGHPGNRGDALLWGEAMGASPRHLSGYQGHGSVAEPHGILITWATIMEGGFQINADGRRFSNEAAGYSEAAASVIRQPNGIAWQIFDGRIAEIARQFEDFRLAEAQGAILSAPDVADLAALMRCPVAAVEATAREVDVWKAAGATDCFGRDWSKAPPLQPPYCAVRVRGALFHTQGGLTVDSQARVLDRAGIPFPNLLAAGGAACGVSGSLASGYLSGNGLLTAVGYGYIAGAAARSFEAK